MSIVVAVMPRLAHTAFASSADCGSLVRYGMKMATTLSASSDDTASAVTSEESTPPESPMTARSKPTLRTPSAMKPRSRPATKPGSIASVSAAESVGLCVVDIVSFVAQQRVRNPRAAQRAPLERMEDEGFIRIGNRSDDGAVGVDHAG